MAEPDARKTLPMLANEWAGCTRCSLAQHRDTVGGAMVFGEGRPGGILFLGEGPGVNEERAGRPFIGRSGELLRKVITHFRIETYYITNIVACRSCAPVLDSTGQPVLSKSFGGRLPQIRYKDQPPTTPQIAACADRIYEEIYMMDPLLIVALGQPAASFLRGHQVKISQVRGVPMEITIPGAGRVPDLSGKKKEWTRKVKGEVIRPTVQSQVRYLMIPTFHPAHVLRQQHNNNPNNPFECFADDLRLAKRLYNRYHEEMSGIIPESYNEDTHTPYELLDEAPFEGNDEQEQN